jgi:hypothetical protein
MTESERVDISLLNHASTLVETGEVRLLTDPWYFGTAFEGGWGLRYDNPEALEQAARATHLWISHFHEDHLHTPTLRELAALNPDIVFLANESYNFDMTGAARRLGFRNVQPFREREPVTLAAGITAMRYPTTGIDNMLLLKGPDWTLLNFNDCVISAFAARRLARQIGRIDLFLTNFNHAGKLLRKQKIDDAKVKAILIENFRRTAAPFNPAHILPFASHHYYRAAESAGQNSAMLNVSELAATDPRVVPLEIGGRASYDPKSQSVVLADRNTASIAPMVPLDRSGGGIPFDLLVAAGKRHARKLRSGFGPLARAVPPLNILVSDLGRIVTLRAWRGIEDAPPGAEADIACHSEALEAWLGKTYGTDSFAVGAHFAILSKRKPRLILAIATGLLAENKLDLRSLFAMLASRGGLRFLLNRREEILGILVSRKVYADYHRE